MMYGFGYGDVNKKKESWKSFSDSIAAKFSIKLSASNSLESLFLNFAHNGVEIQFSESDTRPLKVTFSVIAKSKCEISISREDFIEKCLKMAHLCKEIEVGNKEFDDLYLIKGNDDNVLRKLLTDDIQALMLKTQIYTLYSSYNSETKKIDFTSTINRRVSEIEELTDVHALTCLLVEKLKELKIF